MNKIEQMYRPDEAAKLMRVCRATMYAWIKSGRVKSVRIGPRYTAIPASALRELMSPTEPKESP